jgi:hypothetical protein
MLTCAHDTGGKKLLICSVLMGKTFQCTNLIHGADLQDGHDSHTAPGTQPRPSGASLTLSLSSR